MSNLRDKINDRMDILQEMMETNTHVSDPEAVSDHIYTITKFWSALSEEDRDYIHCARSALEDELPWNV